jgi:hypothetical protein
VRKVISLRPFEMPNVAGYGLIYWRAAKGDNKRGSTISFGLLYGLLILRQSRRELLWLGVTAHPNAQWLARQLTEACGWDEPPRYAARGR